MRCERESAASEIAGGKEAIFISRGRKEACRIRSERVLSSPGVGEKGERCGKESFGESEALGEVRALEDGTA